MSDSEIPAPLQVPSRVLMGPGPSDVPPNVLSAIAAPTIGHLDPRFLKILDEVRTMLQRVFETNNPCTLPMSGTGSAGMETCLFNALEPGDRVLVGLNGVFGSRLAEVARRAGAEVTAVVSEWGRPLDIAALERAAQGQRFDVVCVVHAETSTGVLQPLEPMRQLADRLGALLLADTVTSLGGLRVGLDDSGVDLTYSGTQKCLSCPPGLSPVSLSERAMARLSKRKQPMRSWYLDLSLVGQYWGAERVYHHTAPINALYGLHEGLRSALSEGLPARFQRHRLHSRALAAGLEALGLSLLVPEESRLPPLTLVGVPEGIDEARVRRYLLEELNLEIGAGLGKFKGNAWRIGLMGASATRRHVTLCLAGLANALHAQGQRSAGGAEALAAAASVYGDDAAD